MRLALVSFLAALVAAPLAAQAAQPNPRYAVSLNGRVVASYTYAKTGREEQCILSRMGGERRELVFRSQRPTLVQVARIRERADYRPTAIARTRVTGTIGGRSWVETIHCAGDRIERGRGTCQPVQHAPRLLRLRFRWAGANRIWFRPPAAPGPVRRLCGIEWGLPQRGWLNLAIGRVDEEALLAGRSLRVTGRGEYSRQSNVVSEQELVVGETLTVRWTLTFRRIG
jgi:hypothetical protein